MPNKKTSEFEDNINPSGENIFPIVVSGVTMKQSLSGLTGFFSGTPNTLQSVLDQGNSAVGDFNISTDISSIGINGGELSFIKADPNVRNALTNIFITTPTIDSILKFPAPINTGIYTLATLNDIPEYVDTAITGGTYSDGTTILTNNTGGTISISGYLTGSSTNIDTYVTGGTYLSGTAVFTNNTGGTFTVNGFSTASTSPITIVNTTSLFSSGLVGSGSGSTSTNSIFLGENAGKGTTGISNSIFLGRNSGLNANNATNSVFFGSSAGNSASGVSYSNFFGQTSGYKATGASYSNLFGLNSGYEAYNAYNSNFIGYQAGYRATNAAFSNFFGSAGYQATNATYSNFMGWYAGDSATNATYSNFFGQSAGRNAINAYGSNFFGYQAGRSATDTSFSNLFGYNVGNAYVSDKIGSNNIIIGTNISLPSGATDSINIGGVLFGTGTYSNTGTTPNITGQITGKIGINVVIPQETVDIAGSIKITNPYTSISGDSAIEPIPTGGAGTMVFDTGHFYGWTGSMWKQLDN